MKGRIVPEVSLPRRPVASPLLALALLLISVALHRGSDWLQTRANPSGASFKLWEIAALIVTILLPLVVAVRLERLEARSALYVLRPAWHRSILAILVGFAFALAFNGLWPRIVRPSAQYLEETRNFIRYNGTAELVFVVLLVIVVAPLADELFFRGLLLRSWSARYGTVAAVLSTALATALFHAWEPFKLGHAFVMGVVFAVAVVWTRSVVTSLLLHALLNALALLPGAAP